MPAWQGASGRRALISAFNQEYRLRRIEAKAGRRFTSYQQAEARLRAALGKAAATGISDSIVESVFEGK
jgi:hypothetical protein